MVDAPQGSPPRYEFSGRQGWFGPAAPLLAMLPAAAIGALYALFDLDVPIGGGITLLVLAGAVMAVAGLTGGVLKICRVRNLTAATVAGAVAGATAWYAAWVVFEAGVFKGSAGAPSVGTLAADPVRVGRDLVQLAAFGPVTVMGLAIKGPVAWVVWTIEAAAFLVAIPSLTRFAYAAEMYCEACGRWAVRSPRFLERGLPPGDPVELLGRGVRVLLEAAPAEPGNPRLRLRLRSCPGCLQLHAVTLAKVTLTTDAKGKVSTKSRDLVENVLVSTFDAGLIRPPDRPA